MFYRNKLSTALCVLALLFFVNSCAQLKIDPHGPDKQTVLVLPVQVNNQAERAGRHGFYYIYGIVNEDDLAITYEAIIKTPVKGDMLIIDTLPPGNYRVDKFTFKTVGAGDFTHGQNVFPRNDKFKLEMGRITIFSKSLNVRLFNKIPGFGSETSYSFDLYPVSREQQEAILDTLKTLPNFETWELLGIEEDGPGATVDIGGKYASDASSTSHDVFKTKFRTAIYHLKQTGSQVIVVDGSNVVKVDGTRNGNTVTFTTNRSDQLCKCRNLKGRWTISDDGSKLEGSWKHQDGASGKWNLTKIE